MRLKKKKPEIINTSDFNEETPEEPETPVPPSKAGKSAEKVSKTPELEYLEKMALHLHENYGEYMTADDISQLHPAMIQAELLTVLVAIYDELRALRQLVKSEN